MHGWVEPEAQQRQTEPDNMGPHPGRQKLIVRSFEPKPSRSAEKAPAKAAAPVEAKPPPPAAQPAAPPRIRQPGPGADRKPGLTVTEQRQRKRRMSDLLGLAEKLVKLSTELEAVRAAMLTALTDGAGEPRPFSPALRRRPAGRGRKRPSGRSSRF
jgi:hypothetical protein